MKENELREYLGIVVDIEQNIFLQNGLIKSLEQDIDRLAIPRTISLPEKPQRPMPPKQNKTITVNIVKDVLWSIPGFFVVGIIWAVLAALFDFPLSTHNYFTLYGTTFVIAFVIILAHDIYSTNARNAAMERQYQSEYTSYQQQCKKYDDEIWPNYEKRLSQCQQQIEEDKIERNNKLTFLRSECGRIEQLKIESNKRLASIYAMNIIFPKYRNFVMVSSLYEYIQSGRCSTLEGHEGAYNILELEIRLDHIITQLDSIVSHLEEIKRNQFALYTSIQTANLISANILQSTVRMADSLQDMTSSISSISDHSRELNARIIELQKTSEITAYQAERTQKELHYMNRMKYYSGEYDEVFFNIPPT